MFTVLGHSGFIGSHIVSELKKRGYDIYLPGRDEDLRKKNLGKVIYCIGLTSDAREKPFESIEAHIGKLGDVIRYSLFDDITYASSTRIYIHNSNYGIASENQEILVNVLDLFDFFNLTKLTAESLLLNTIKNVKIIRYSNVYGTDFGSGNFLSSIISEAVNSQKVTLFTTPDSSKDYISVNEAARLTVDISLSGKEKIYNIASGFNVENVKITDRLSNILECQVVYSENAKQVIFPVIDTTLIRKEFGYRQEVNVIDDLDNLIFKFKNMSTIK